MGLYAQLLTRYLRVPPDALGQSLRDADIAVDMQARPVFLDDRSAGRTPAGVSASTAASHSRQVWDPREALEAASRFDPWRASTRLVDHYRQARRGRDGVASLRSGFFGVFGFGDHDKPCLRSPVGPWLQRNEDDRMTEPALSGDLEALDDFLLSDRAPPDSMGLSDLDGFLTGLVAGPETIMPSEWLPVIWGGEGPAFGSIEEAQAVLGAIMGRHNEIARGLDGDPERFAPVFLEGPDGSVIAESWAEGFMAGPRAARRCLEPDDPRQGGAHPARPDPGPRHG